MKLSTTSLTLPNSMGVASRDAHLRVLFDNTNEHAICMLDERGHILSWNLSAERLMGYKSKEVLGKSYAIFFSPEEKRRNVPQKALTSALRKGRYSADGIRLRKNGSHFWARSFITPVRQGKRGPVQFVLITHDVSRARAIEQKKEEYIGIASHELRSPIQTLSLYAELLGQRLLLDADTENLQTLRDMQVQTARLVTLIDDLLMVSKVEGGSMSLLRETFDPVRVFKSIVSDYRNLTSGQRIIMRGKQGVLVRADKSRIAQVLINLLTNSVKYSRPKEKIVVDVRVRNGKCIVSIRDLGAGISAHDQRHIFTRFYRTKSASASGASGVGLGLYISKEIIKRHRERIWVKSKEGQGTTFYFTSPMVR